MSTVSVWLSDCAAKLDTKRKTQHKNTYDDRLWFDLLLTFVFLNSWKANERPWTMSCPTTTTITKKQSMKHESESWTNTMDHSSYGSLIRFEVAIFWSFLVCQFPQNSWETPNSDKHWYEPFGAHVRTWLTYGSRSSSLSGSLHWRASPLSFPLQVFKLISMISSVASLVTAPKMSHTTAVSFCSNCLKNIALMCCGCNPSFLKWSLRRMQTRKSCSIYLLNSWMVGKHSSFGSVDSFLFTSPSSSFTLPFVTSPTVTVSFVSSPPFTSSAFFFSSPVFNEQSESVNQSAEGWRGIMYHSYLVWVSMVVLSANRQSIINNFDEFYEFLFSSYHLTRIDVMMVAAMWLRL